MSDEASSRVFAWLFWIPLASLLATEVYVSHFDGRGAWAAAPLFLVPLFLSVVIAGAGVIHCIVELRNRSRLASSVLLTIVAALPVLWLLVRRYVV